MQTIAANVGRTQPMPTSNSGSMLNAETSRPATFAASINANSSDTSNTERYATRGFGSLLRTNVSATKATATGIAQIVQELIVKLAETDYVCNQCTSSAVDDNPLLVCQFRLRAEEI